MKIMNIRAALHGMVTTRDITEIMDNTMRIITGVIAQLITSIIMHKSRHAERVLRKISTITTTITANGGTFGNQINPGQ
jgi:hypothetical protein